MATTTENSPSAVAVELRGSKVPAPDAEFFRPFLPEIAFALVFSLVAVAISVFFSKLSSKPVIAVTSEDLRKKAEREILSIGADDPDFAAKTWASVRRYLSETFGNPFFPNMTPSEAAKAASNVPGVVGLAETSRELAYFPPKASSSAKERLRELALSVIRSSK